MGPTRVNRKLPNECFESGEEQIKGYGKVTQNTEIFSTKYGNNISEVGSPAYSIDEVFVYAAKSFQDMVQLDIVLYMALRKLVNTVSCCYKVVQYNVILHIDGLVQDCSISITNALEILNHCCSTVITEADLK